MLTVLQALLDPLPLHLRQCCASHTMPQRTVASLALLCAHHGKADQRPSKLLGTQMFMHKAHERTMGYPWQVQATLPCPKGVKGGRTGLWCHAEVQRDLFPCCHLAHLGIGLCH